MKKNFYWLLVCVFFFSTSSVLSQIKNEPQKPLYVGTPTSVVQVPSIASRQNLPVFKGLYGEMQDGRASKYDVIPGKGSSGDDALAKRPHRLKNKIRAQPPSLVFETAASDGGGRPSDPAGAVGPNHYFAVTNTAFRIFDKAGNPLTDLLVPNPTIFPSGGCCDLTASYDNAADRWVLSFLGGGVQIAVSNGPDPVNDGWTTYTYGVVQDYQKLSVWSDGYYMTENTGSAEKLHVFDRAAMLAGDPQAAIQSFALPGMVIAGFHSPQVLNITDDNTPAAGNATVVYMQDDSWNGVANDHIKVWSVNVDWDTPGNSSVSAALELGNADGVTDFNSTFDGGSFSNLTQPNGGQDIDALQWTMMNQAQYRKFPTYNSALFNFVVDADGSPAELAAVRWYELRQTADGEPWTVYQEGTYTAPDGKHAWNASLAMDGQGNIGLGYTAMSGPSTPTATFVGSYYTGRFANDPLGTMTIDEETIMAGDANIPSPERYGDYSKIDVDPTNDKGFWFVNELMQNGVKNVAGVFQIAPNFAKDVGVISIDSPTSTGTFGNAEIISVTLFNFGIDPIGNFDVSYQIDGGTVITETYAGTLASATSDTFTFSATADLSVIGSYTILSKTNLTGDEDINNDPTTLLVTNLAANDVGVIAVTAPTSAEGLGNEAITITMENFGGAPQSGFDVSYVLDGGAAIVENYGGTINSGETANYTFTALGDFSTLGEHEVVARTVSVGDADVTNDSFTAEIVNLSCTTETNATSQPVGPNQGTITTSVITFADNFAVNDVNVTLNINHTWVNDLGITLEGPDGTKITIVNRVGGPADQNLTETMLDDEANTAIANGSAPFTGTFQPSEPLSAFDGIMSAGDWILEITDNADIDGGNLINWSLQLCSNDALSIDDNTLVDSGYTIIYQDNNQFLVKLETPAIQEKLNLNVYNVLGQTLSWKTLENETGNGYEHKLDMSYVSAGVYFVKIGNSNASNTKRIIVR